MKWLSFICGLIQQADSGCGKRRQFWVEKEEGKFTT